MQKILLITEELSRPGCSSNSGNLKLIFERGQGGTPTTTEYIFRIVIENVRFSRLCVTRRENASLSPNNQLREVVSQLIAADTAFDASVKRTESTIDVLAIIEG